MKHKPSLEQLAIIDEIEHTNVTVDAVAGSGKTTTVLHMAHTYKEKKLLQLTYNKNLKEETRLKVQLEKLENLEIQNYHSFCCIYYKQHSFKDEHITNIIEKDTKKILPFKYDIIIIDECQDMKPLFFTLVLKIIKDNKNDSLKMCILGDVKQSIYEFMYTDSRYLTLSNKLFNVQSSLETWSNLKLTESFRVTEQIAKFINICMLKQNRITATKQGVKPRYLVCNTWSESSNRLENAVLNEVQYYLDLGYKYEDIFILAPSVKGKASKAPVMKLANIFSDKLKIPINAQVDDDAHSDKDEMKNKICFATHHASKGLERKVIIVFCFDSYFFKCRQYKDRPLDICPNELYVAVTRAQERLTIIHSYDQSFLSFLDKSKLSTYCDIINPENAGVPKPTIKVLNEELMKESPTSLLRFIPTHVRDNMLSYITYTQIRPPSKVINIPLKTKNADLTESVSEITGTAIPAYYEYLKTGKMTINKDINKNLINLSPSCLLEIATLYNSNITGFKFKVNQIKKYDWLSKVNLDKAMSRLSNISTNAIFEKELTSNILNYNITGRADCIDKSSMWEFKCVSNLDKLHYIQLAIYMFLRNKDKELLQKTIKELPKSKKFIELKQKFKLFRTLRQLDKIKNNYVYNILDDNLIKVESSPENLIEMMNYLIEFKKTSKKEVLDLEFLKEVEKIKEKYITEIQKLKEVIKNKQKSVKCIYV